MTATADLYREALAAEARYILALRHQYGAKYLTARYQPGAVEPYGPDALRTEREWKDALTPWLAAVIAPTTDPQD